MILVAALLALALPVAAPTATWKVDKPSSCAVVCTAIETPPVVPPGPPQPPVEPPPVASACDRLDKGFSARFLEVLSRTPPVHFHDYTFFVARALTDEERACARQRNVPGSTNPTARPPGDHPAEPPIEPSHFRWEQVGHWKRVRFQAGQVESFSTDVPHGFAGVLRGSLGEGPGSPDTVQIRIWFSLAPGGPAIPGSEYEGLYLAHFFATPEFRPPTGRVYFNVLLKDKSGSLDVKLAH